MEPNTAQIFRQSAVPLLTAVLVYAIAATACFLMLAPNGWLPALVLSAINLPVLIRGWQQVNETWLLVDWNGITLSAPGEIRFVSWREAERLVRDSTEGSGGTTYHVMKRGTAALTFDDDILSSDVAAELIESLIAKHRNGVVRTAEMADQHPTAA